MRITFDPSFAKGVWPGAPNSTVGEPWVGQGGMLGLLETALGLRAPEVSETERAAALLEVVTTQDGFWSESAKIDSLGAAGRLLSMRDELVLAGWDGRPTGTRFDALAAVTASARPGTGDRLRAVERALADQSTDFHRVTRIKPVDDLPPLWGRVFALLKKQGVGVEDIDLEPAPAHGDLLAARQPNFAPKHDGTFEVLRPYGPLEAAEQVAAMLAARGSTNGVVVVGAAPVLDAALRRHGLPTLGTGPRAGHNVLLQLLPLVTGLAFPPADPAQALELLIMPANPLRSDVAWPLAVALSKTPAVGSDAWNEARASALGRLAKNTAEHARMKERIEVIFETAIARGAPCPREQLLARIDVLLHWLHGVAETEPAGAARYRAAAAQCAEVRKALIDSGRGFVTAVEAQRLIRQATRNAHVVGTHGAEAGLVKVAVPGAVTGPADMVVWWAFDRASAAVGAPLRVTESEREALTKAGAEFHSPRVRTLANAERARRPLMQARETLLCVCPEVDEFGEAQHPHPVWDEIVAGLAKNAHANALFVQVPSALVAAAKPRAIRPLALARRDWKTDALKAAVAAPAGYSPSTAGVLIGCPFRWAVEKVAKLGRGATDDLESGPLLFGNVAHKVIEKTLETVPTTEAQARERAGATFDELAPRLAGALYLDGADTDRATVRAACEEAAASVLRVCAASKLEVRETERKHESDWLEVALHGQVDLVLGDPPVVVDFKWGREADRREEIEAGTAYQLATYSHLLSEGPDASVPAAYYILATGHFIAPSGTPLVGVAETVGPSMNETLEAFVRAIQRTRTNLREGELRAAGVQASDDAPTGVGDIEDQVLRLAAPCRYCGYAALCGRTLGVPDTGAQDDE